MSKGGGVPRGNESEVRDGGGNEVNQDVANDEHKSEAFAELGEIGEHARSLKSNKGRSETTIRFQTKEEIKRMSIRSRRSFVPENSSRRSIGERSEISSTHS